MSGETEASVSGWTTDTLHSMMISRFDAVSGQIDDLRLMLDERYATQVKAVDAAFAAQVLAMQTALQAAERANQTALASAEKAVAKAEAAADKRFEAMNEFRGQLSDQASTFMPRTEADVRIAALAEKLDNEVKRSSERNAELVSRLDTSAGVRAGSSTVYAWAVAAVSMIVSVIVIVNIITGR